MANGQTISGLKMAPKASIISLIWNLVSPKCSLTGRIPAKDDDGIEGRGVSKKRMLICNGSDRGSNFASIQKDADLLMVISCVNGNKPTNVRYSTTPKGERLTDSYVNWLLSGITKSVKTTDARYRKGLKSLEPYEGKLSSTVPRGERRSNSPDLPD